MAREGKLLIIAELWGFDVAVSLRGTNAQSPYFIVCSALLRVFKHSQNVKRPLLSASE